MRRMSTVYAGVISLFLLSCAAQKDMSKESLPYSPIANHDLNANLLSGKRSFQTLNELGPISIDLSENKRLFVSMDESFAFDYAKPLNNEPAPLVIFHHGNKYIKEAHRNQIIHLASWGFHAVSVQSINEYNWIKNGHRLKKLVDQIVSNPHVLSSNIDTRQILLVGHSFGGSAVTIASSLSKNVKGIILLDPAVVSDTVLRHQKSSDTPAILLGADPKVFRARRRSTFYKNMSNLKVELTVTSATHNDAQNPPITSAIWGTDPTTNIEKIELFTHLITACAFTLTADEKFNSFAKFLKNLEKEKEIESVKIKSLSFNSKKNRHIDETLSLTRRDEIFVNDLVAK